MAMVKSASAIFSAIAPPHQPTSALSVMEKGMRISRRTIMHRIAEPAQLWAWRRWIFRRRAPGARRQAGAAGGRNRFPRGGLAPGKRKNGKRAGRGKVEDFVV